jgi:hypothetical protein
MGKNTFKILDLKIEIKKSIFEMKFSWQTQ